MNNKKRFSSMIGVLLLIAVLAIGTFAFSGCRGGETCTEHDFKIDPLTATCEKSGLVSRHCSKCGFYDEVESPALGHNFSEWSVLQEASCRYSGEKRRSCERCHIDETEEIAKLSHTVEAWAINTKPTAEAVGRASGRCTVDACGEYVYVDLPVLNETNYTVEVVDSESKTYIIKTGDYEVEVFISNYSFNEVYVNGKFVGYGVYITADTTTEKLVLPSTYNGYPVVSIYQDSFQNMSHVKEVVIPEGVKTVGSGVFQNCPNLEKVTLPSSIEEIGYNYFADYDSCFDDQVDVYYNGTVENWCNIKLYETTPFGGTTLRFDNIYFIDEDGQYEALTEITVPASVTSIGDCQFYNFSTLTKVNLHGNITSIGNYAFSRSGLTSFTMPDSVTSVGESAFSSCSSLEAIALSQNIEVIERNAFNGCTSLTSISIPSKVKNVKYYAFNGCTSLAEVKINADSLLQEIGEQAFYGCSDLTNIVIPSTVLTVGRNAFAYPLQTIYYMGNATAFDYIEGKNHLKVSGSTIYYYSKNVPMNTEYTYWYYDEDSVATLWILGTVVNGKEYTYSRTETTVTDQYWGMLKAAEAQGMLEMLFPSSELGAELAQQQIEMVTSSSTKAEYEEKLCAFSASAGQGSSYKFDNGKVTITINGQAQTAIDYVEFDNVIYVANGRPLCYIDTENNCIYEVNETEHNTVWHYYELVSND